MKRKETFWELLERLDRQAGEFNIHLSEANRYFDTAATKTKVILEQQEKELHDTIAKVKAALKKFKKENEGNGKEEKEK
jgi:ABC-type transporter Mla subunit MlaD